MKQFVNLCPSCQNQVMVDETMIGQETQCSLCNNTFTVYPPQKSSTGKIIAVVSIVAFFVIAFLVISLFFLGVRKSRAISCTNNMKQLALNFSMYSMDNNGYFPDTGFSIEAIDFFEKLYSDGYVQDKKFLLCKSDNKSTENSYDYVAYKKYDDMPFGSPFFFEHSPLHGGRYNVAFTDGHVQTMTENYLNEDLNKATGVSLPISELKKGKVYVYPHETNMSMEEVKDMYNLVKNISADVACKYARIAARQGDAELQAMYGVCLFLGNGVAKNYTEAVKWFKKSAKQGNAIGQFCLGVCYYEGTGVDKDINEAKKWLALASAQGHKEAQELLLKIGY